MFDKLRERLAADIILRKTMRLEAQLASKRVLLDGAQARVEALLKERDDLTAQVTRLHNYINAQVKR